MQRDAKDTIVSKIPTLRSSVDVTGGGFRYQPIHCAAEAGQIAMVEYLLGRGAKIDAPIFTEMRSLYPAAGYGWPRMVKFPFDHAADPNARSTHGETALDWAKAQKQSECIALLETYKPAPAPLSSR